MAEQPIQSRLVSVRLDRMRQEWVVRCAVCGEIARLRQKKYWTAARMVKPHEDTHE